jgi:hypothetical protein
MLQRETADPATTIRPSEDRDIPAIAEIYAHHVLHGVGDRLPPHNRKRSGPGGAHASLADR